jgi:hypothetical protein
MVATTSPSGCSAASKRPVCRPPDFSGALAQVIPELQSRLGREFDRLIDTGRQLSRAELVQVVLDGLDEAVAS